MGSQGQESQKSRKSKKKTGKSLAEGRAPDAPEVRTIDEDGPVARRIRRRTLGRAIREAPGEELAWGIRDLSTTGAFLETKAPLEIGTEFDLSLVLGTAVIHVMARVARIQEPSWQHVGGAGIEFTRVSQGAQAFLESYIEASEGEYL